MYKSKKRMRARVVVLGLAVLVVAAACDEQMTVDQGSDYTSASTTTISGTVTAPENGHSRVVSVTVNSTEAAVDGNRYTAQVPLDGAAILNRVLVTSKWSDKSVLRERRTVVYGDGNHGTVVPKTTQLPKASGLRLNDTGLASLAGQIKQGVNLNVADLAAKDKLLYQSDPDGWPNARAFVNQAPSISSWKISVDPQPDKVQAKITLDDLAMRIYIDTNIVFGEYLECGYIKINADSVTVDADFRLGALESDPSKLDVNMKGDPTVALNGFSWRWDGGICDTFSGIVNSFLPDLQSTLSTGLVDAIKDPDGAGGADSPVAAAIESALANVNIAGDLGNALGVTMTSRIGNVIVDHTGVSLQADTSFVAGSAVPGAPSLSSIVSYNDTLPPLEGQSHGWAYDVAVGLSASSFNQLLASQTERGLLNATITSIGGQALTLRSLFDAAAPGLGATVPDSANVPLKIVLSPQVAPIVEPGAGSGTHLANLRIGGYRVRILRADNDGLLMDLVMDMTAPLDFTVSNGALRIVLSPPAAGDLHVDVLASGLPMSSAQVEAVLQSMSGSLFASVTQALQGFPLPAFAGKSLQPVGFAREGTGLVLFAKLV